MLHFGIQILIKVLLMQTDHTLMHQEVCASHGLENIFGLNSNSVTVKDTNNEKSTTLCYVQRSKTPILVETIYSKDIL